ncbi:related to integral membrane protein [Ramularia collo-cygni]|uniref:Related to integral membrane protein n=1 Tax=Ramularia collo-cygni TaxID=112498 RepID=A0A2D3VFY2_9PEZI|nr:related to integral membrane protein [Ramularia collo-cygni]CZT24835.1 related to integral membrane protein [Ramularia collo-cygni]
MSELLAPPSFHAGDTASVKSMALMDLGKWRRVVGLFLLAVTIFLWTATNFLASTIFADDTYSKPYLVTYINTSFFILPLIPLLFIRHRRNPEHLAKWSGDFRSRIRRQYAPVVQSDESGEAGLDSPLLENASSMHLDDSQVLNPKNPYSDTTDVSTALAPLSLPEIAKLSLEFCLLWFLANYFVAACLQYTSVASSTILTSTSSVFTLLFGAIFKVEKFTVSKLLGVGASLSGIILISLIDLSGRNNNDEHRGDFPEKSNHEIAVGDMLAFLSAVMYGLYAVFMKKRITDETRVDMPVFFGLVGLINVLILWPGFVILHYTGIETFEMPPTGTVTLIIIFNSLASLVADMAWAYAVLLTSPIVVTVGLSITIPLSLIGQIVLVNQTVGAWYWIGACIVVGSFLFVNHDEKKAVEAGEGAGEVP